MPPARLRLGDHMERERGLAGAFRAVDLDDPAARQAADAERDVEPERAGRDHLGLHRLLALAEPHDRALAEGALDLAEGGVESLVLVHGFLADNAERSLRHGEFLLISQPWATCNASTVPALFSIWQDQKENKMTIFLEQLLVVGPPTRPICWSGTQPANCSSILLADPTDQGAGAPCTRNRIAGKRPDHLAWGALQSKASSAGSRLYWSMGETG